MSELSEERWMAWLDGELDEAAAADVARVVAADPALAERARRERAMRARLRAAFASIEEEAPPSRLLDTLGMGADAAAHAPVADNVVAVRPRPAAERIRHYRWPEWTALAASVVLGVLFGAYFLGGSSQAPVRMQGGVLMAGTELARALDRELAADARPGAEVVIGLSFRDGEGRYCRTFTANGAQPMGGLACRDHDQWRVVALGQAERQQGEFRQAASALPPSVLAEVDARQQEVLDAAGERAARDAGWR